jgi:DNA-dependent RNA polymerase auxiliary subunit epsilon
MIDTTRYRFENDSSLYLHIEPIGGAPTRLKRDSKINLTFIFLTDIKILDYL